MCIKKLYVKMANFVPNMKYFCYFCREESMYIYVREHNPFLLFTTTIIY